MELQDSFMCLHEAAIRSSLEPDESNPHPSLLFFKTRFNIIIPSRHRSCKRYFPFGLTRNFAHASLLPHASYKSHPSHPSWSYHNKNIWWRDQTVRQYGGNRQKEKWRKEKNRKWIWKFKSFNSSLRFNEFPTISNINTVSVRNSEVGGIVASLTVEFTVFLGETC